MIISNSSDSNGFFNKIVFGEYFFGESSSSFSDGNGGKFADDVQLDNVIYASPRITDDLVPSVGPHPFAEFTVWDDEYFSVLLTHIELHKVMIIARPRLGTKWNSQSVERGWLV